MGRRRSTSTHEDVLVCGDDPEAVDLVVELASTVTGRPGVKAGRLRLARQLEPLTAVLISINKAYKTAPGVAISGRPRLTSAARARSNSQGIGNSSGTGPPRTSADFPVNLALPMVVHAPGSARKP